jgi:hypothetical protein
MRNLRYYLWCKLSLLRDKSPDSTLELLDWIRYELLYDTKDKRHWYD